MIRLEGLTKRYQTSHGDVLALDGVDLEIDTGEFIAVRGPSGCGKSTLLSLTGGLDLPTSGRVVVDDREISAMSSGERATWRSANVGFVFQMFHLLPYLTVVENVMLASMAGHEAEARQTALELLDKFLMKHRLHHRPAQLSTGERQRVAMARALLNRPKLILADEPTGNLDPENATGLLNLLADFHNEGGTVLLVTHEDLAASYASRTVTMREGQIVPAPATSQSA